MSKSSRTKPVPPAKRETSRNKYAPEIVDRALCALAYFNGNSRKASEALKEHGVKVPRSTLRRWPIVHADRYEELRGELIPRVHERVAEKHLELADAEIELSAAFIERMRRELDEVPVRDLSTFQRNLDTGSGIHTDKAAMLRGQGPAAPVVNINLVDVVRSMAYDGVPFFDRQGRRLTAEEAIEGVASPVPPTSSKDEDDGNTEN